MPLEALKFNFLLAGKPAALYDNVELPGDQGEARRILSINISGRLGEKERRKKSASDLEFLTQRGVVLLNVDPAMCAGTMLASDRLPKRRGAIVRGGD